MASTYRRRFNPDELNKKADEKAKERVLDINKISAEANQLSKVNPLAKNNALDVEGSVPIPQLYGEDGKLNERYNSSIGEDMLAGVAIGSQTQGTGLERLAGQLGGLVGGIFSKNVAGRKKFERDLGTANAINEAAYAKSNAQLRLEAQEANRLFKEQQLKIQASRAKSAEIVALGRQKGKEQEGIREAISASYSDGDMETVRKLQRDLNANMGLIYSEDAIPDDWGINWGNTPIKSNGLNYIMSKDGRNTKALLDTATGRPLSSLTLTDFLKISKEVNKTELTDQELTSVYDNAVRLVGNLEKSGDLNFKDTKGRINNVARTAQISKIATQLLQSKKNNVDLKTIEVDGQPYSITDYINGGTTTSATPPVQTVTSDSPFIPNDTGTTPVVVDATKPFAQPNNTLDLPINGKVHSLSPAEEYYDATTKKTTRYYPLPLKSIKSDIQMNTPFTDGDGNTFIRKIDPKTKKDTLYIIKEQ